VVLGSVSQEEECPTKPWKKKTRAGVGNDFILCKPDVLKSWQESPSILSSPKAAQSAS